MTVRDDRLVRVQQVCRMLDEQVEQRPSLADLAAAVGWSPPHLQRTFKAVVGLSPREYADAARLGRLKEALRQARSVTTSLVEAGFGSPSRLYERAGERLGMTPGQYRAGGRHTTLHHATAACPLGRVLLAGTERGVSAVYLGDEDGPLVAELSREFPAARLIRDDGLLREWLECVVRHLEGTSPALDLPLDVRATAFQWGVWQQLRAIPAGTTATYREVAARLGSAKGARAVARACATNPVSLVVPCHRVVREDGGLGGYRWGLHRKQALLDREREEGRGGSGE